MITIFNRKELFVTFDLQKQAEIRQILQANGIDYQIKVTNRKSASPVWSGTRAYTGTFGEDLSQMNEYKIFVHKDDYEQAVYLMQK